MDMDSEEMRLSPEHKNALKKFRSKLQDILKPDHTDEELINCLIGNNFDLKRAERMFREVDSCRKMMGFETILDTYTVPEKFRKFGRTGFLGFAKDGSAIRYYFVHSDLLGMTYSCSLSEALTFFVYTMETDFKQMKERNEKTGQNNTKVTYIIDFEDFSYSDLFHTAVINVGLEMFSKFQDHYPETWSKFLIINVPYIFDKILLLFKPVFKNRFLDYFHIAMKNSTSSLLKKFIDDDVIPSYLGGSRVDSTGDPRCREILKEYLKVPEEYYSKNSKHFLEETDPGVKVAILRPWSVYNVPVIVKEAGAKMRIELRSDDGAFHVTVFHRSFSSDSEDIELPEWNEKLDSQSESSNLRVLIPRSKLHSHVSPEDFMTYAHWPGIYIFHFENSSSWFASRKIYYRFTVFPQDTQG